MSQGQVERMVQITKDLIEESDLPFTQAEKELMHIGAVDYVAASMWAQSLIALYAARLSERALKNHAEALQEATKASEKYARHLVIATWALVLATVVLAVIALLPLVAKR